MNRAHLSLIKLGPATTLGNCHFLKNIYHFFEKITIFSRIFPSVVIKSRITGNCLKLDDIQTGLAV